MEGYTITGITPQTFPVENTPWILILHADKQPVHVAFVYNNLYYSLTFKGADTAVPLENRLKLIRIRHIPCLWIQLNDPILPITSDDISRIFTQYPPLQSTDSCLTPIWQLLQNYYQIPLGDPLIFGMMDALIQHHKILRISSDQLKGIENGEFSILRYTIETVGERITQLNASTKKN